MIIVVVFPKIIRALPFSRYINRNALRAAIRANSRRLFGDSEFRVHVDLRGRGKIFRVDWTTVIRRSRALKIRNLR